MNGIPPFDEGLQRFREHLVTQGVTDEPLWIFHEDVFAGGVNIRVKVPLPVENPSLVRAAYEAGRRRGLGVWLTVFCFLHDRPCCYIWLPRTAQEAAAAGLVPDSLKCTMPYIRITAKQTRLRLSWFLRNAIDRVLTTSPRISDEVPSREKIAAISSM